MVSGGLDADEEALGDLAVGEPLGDQGEHLLESIFYPPLSFSVTLPGWFGVHFQRMRDYARFACAGVLIGTEANGRVKGTSLSRALFGPIDYRMTAADLANLRRGMARLAEVFFEAGAEVVLPATFADTPLEASVYRDRPGELLAFLEKRIHYQ